MAILLGGALTGVLAICAVAGLFILKTASTKDPANSSTTTVAQQQSQTAASPSFTPFDVVPEACDMLKPDFTKKLVPGAQPAPPANISTDLESGCSWGDFTRNDARELTVDLYGYDGATPIQDAKDRFVQQWKDDRDGQSAGVGEKLRYSGEIKGLAESAYALYYVGGNTGSAIVSARVGNVLVTIRFSGRSSKDAPMSQSTALSGAQDAAEIVVAEVKRAGEAQPAG